MEFSRQEYWSALPFCSPGEFPNPGIKLGCPALQAEIFTISVTRGAILFIQNSNFGGKQAVTKSLRGSVRNTGTHAAAEQGVAVSEEGRESAELGNRS